MSYLALYGKTYTQVHVLVKLRAPQNKKQKDTEVARWLVERGEGLVGGRGIGKGDERDQSVLYICMTLSKNRLIKNFNCFPFSKKMVLITLMIFFFWGAIIP